jgi:Domain of unknown function (DUF5615)
MPYYLDADISQRVAAIVRRLDPGIDITSAQELRHSRVSDADELALATAQGRCIVTRNHRDFAPLARAWLSEGREHTGMLFVPGSLANDNFSGLAAAIVRYDRNHPHGIPPNLLDWLDAERG